MDPLYTVALIGISLACLLTMAVLALASFDDPAAQNFPERPSRPGGPLDYQNIDTYVPPTVMEIRTRTNANDPAPFRRIIVASSDPALPVPVRVTPRKDAS